MQTLFFFFFFATTVAPFSLAQSADRYADAQDTSEEQESPPPNEGLGQVFKGSKNGNSSRGYASPHGLGLGIGQTFLLGNFSDHGSDDLTADLFYRYKASHSFDLLTNFHMSTQKDSGDREKMEIMALTTGIKGRYFNFDHFSPFLLGGLGFYRPKATRYINGSLVESENKIVLGTHFGAGVELNLTEKFSFALQGIYHYPFRSKQDTQTSLTGSYFKLMMALFYNF